MQVFENYLLKDFKNHAADLGPVLVDTCSDANYAPINQGKSLACLSCEKHSR